MPTLAHRLGTIGLMLALAAGNAAICAGWAATPEARMAFRSADADCPMHEGATQAQVVSCCASCDSDRSSRAYPSVVVTISSAVLGPGSLVAVTPPPLVLSDGWRTAAPIRIAPIPRHVLLSVFLI